MSPDRNDDLHGSAPDKCAVAHRRDQRFRLSRGAPASGARPTDGAANRGIEAAGGDAGVPIIYANDNFGRWRSDFPALVEHCTRPESRGRQIAELLRPGENDYFVLKPKHSGFFSTTLDILLRYLHVRTVVLTGLAGNNCVLFTAHDAYLRDLHIVAPEDCVASNTLEENRQALHQIRTVLKGDTRPSAEIDWRALRQPTAGDHSPDFGAGATIQPLT